MEPTSSTHSHTKLYIILAILVVLAALFFAFNPAARDGLDGVREEEVVNEVPIEQATLTLTAEQKAKQEASLNDPQYSKTQTLTPAQQAAHKKSLNAEIKPSM